MVYSLRVPGVICPVSLPSPSGPSPCMWLSHTPTPLPHLTAWRASELSVRVSPASFPLSLPSLAGSPVFVMEDSTKMVEVARASWPHPRSLGRHRARCLTVRLPMPPVRPVRETFASYGSRQRDIMGKVHFASSTAHSPWTALRVRWLPVYCFPTLSLGAFAVSPRPGVPSFPGFRLLCPI